MTIAIRDDLTYILLKQIGSGNGTGESEIRKAAQEYVGREVAEAELLGHLDYLNQRQFIKAEFSGQPYGGAELLPPLVAFQKADLTEKGRKLLQKLETNPPKSLHQEGSAVPIATKDMPFLEKVMVNGNMEDIFDARDITELVYRIMRDLMTTEASERVEAELHKEVLPTDDKTLQKEIADLWKDTNPLVGLLSRVRRPLTGEPAPVGIDSNLFAFRVEQEGALPSGVKPETAIAAVFSATKDELSEERIQEIAGFLPDRIREIWKSA
ncbi:DUF2267 domain-containing protein [Microcoleus sp. LEGE 07076]|uniref:DUF2267 domain-containing protein n=1 Tax=Microcoleus sp. LEGE 07076 TaxID=915322 RepID=UPI0018813434|nr:DUF2267 domain-containing protein [Microcoleus sp. LEGE 07076]MBE9184727.1 DUF2267 domain-containing protein [Microcoleus sp. LEGE 07076]